MKAWIHGEWNNKEAHWLHINNYLTILVRATSISCWRVSVNFGSMSELAGTFKREELNEAKAAGIEFARQFVGELGG